MKKVLSRIVSTALMAAVISVPAMGQYAKKAKGGQSARAAVTMKAESRNMRVPKKVNGFQPPRVKTTKTKGLNENTGVRHISPRVNRTVAHAASDMPQIYGSILFSGEWNETAEYGLYTVPTGADQNFSKLFETSGAANYGGACKDGVYYMNFYTTFMGFIPVFEVYGYDVATGEEVYYSSADPMYFAPGGMALDPKTNEIYGIFFDDEAEGFELASISYDSETPTKTTIAPLDGSWVAFSVASDGTFYGIRTNDSTSEGELCKINRTTAEVTFVGATGQYPYYQSGACIDAKSNRMFWALSPEDDSGFLTEVNLSTGATEVIKMFDYGEEVSGMYVPVAAAEDKAPGECIITNTTFDGASLEGFMYVTAPEKLFDGTAGTGQVDMHVDVNGENLANINNVDFGEQVIFNLDLTSKGAGMYTFTVYASNSVGDGPKTKVKNIWVGADTPEATKASLAYVNGNMEVTWNAVTGSVNGGYIDLDNLTYTVKRADGSVAASGLTTTAFTEAVAEPASLTSYYYTVEVVCGDMVSAPARTNTVALGSIVPPYTSDFAADGIAGWTVIDGNDDGKVWSVYDGELRMTYNSSLDMDDWAITPALKLEGNKSYTLTFSAHAGLTSYAERIEVKMGKTATADGMTEVLLEPTSVTTPAEYEVRLMPEEDGIYYVGFHGISDANMFYLLLGNITIEAGVSALAPGLATDLVVTPDASGAFKANVAFNAPSKALNNTDLASLTKVELLRGEEVVHTFTNPQPGAALTYDDVMTEGGDVMYSVIGYNNYGTGLKATATAYIGFNVPVSPASATLSRTAVDGEALITWEPVTQDVNGLVYPADAVTYSVYNANDVNSLVLLADGLKTTSYSYQAVPDGEQDTCRYAVFAVSAAGTGQGTLTSMEFIGTPLDGLHEIGNLEQAWIIMGIDGGQWGLYNEENLGIPAQAGDNYFGCKGQYLDTGGALISPRVSLVGMDNPGVTFYTYNILGDNPDINELEVLVKTDDAAEYTSVFKKTVEEICGEGVEGWGRATVSLQNFANKVVQVKFVALTKQYVYTLLDDITVGTILAHDLAVTAINAPGKVKAGTDYSVDVTVANDGAQDAASFTVELYADGDLAESMACENLAASARTTVKFNRIMSAIATESVEYYAKVVYAADENLNNNQTSSVTVAPIVSTLPVATDLKGASQADGIKLTWNEPNLEGGVAVPVTDDFEDADSFAAEYGDWTFADLDGSPVGGFQNMDIPGITSFETTGSFWVWDQSLLGNDTFAAHSGTKYLFALFNSDGSGGNPVQNSDWAISPELTGDAQTISFYARSYSSDYPEAIAVYYSTGSKEAADFVKIDDAGSDEVPGDWTLFEAELPAGAKYFAIVCESYDSFMLMVDDVTYTPASSTADLSIAGYNVYRDGVKINDKLVEDTTFVDGNVTEGTQYTYVVTVVYTDKGETAASNEVVITYSGTGVNNLGDGAVSVSVDGNDIVVLNAEGLPVSVASANGVVLFNGVGELRTTVTVGNGVYVVKAGNTVRKLVVR